MTEHSTTEQGLSHHPNDTERNYISWRHHINRVIQMQTGRACDTFPTGCQFEYREAFAAQMTPKDVVNAILDRAGWAR